jgi:hypothetical protein
VIKAIEMNREDMEEILKHMPEHLKAKIEDLIKEFRPDSGIEYLREFVEKYEDDDMFDHIVSHTMSNIFRRTRDAVNHILKAKKREKQDPRINTVEMGIITIEVLRKEAENIEEALDTHEKKCDRGDKCGAKH